MTNETKPDIEVNANKVENKESNIRALLIVAAFVVLFIALIVFEVASKK